MGSDCAWPPRIPRRKSNKLRQFLKIVASARSTARSCPLRKRARPWAVKVASVERHGEPLMARSPTAKHLPESPGSLTSMDFASGALHHAHRNYSSQRCAQDIV
jgi:hypothetical protein